MNNLKRRALTMLLSLAMILSYMPMSMITAYAEAGQTPNHNKLLTDNHDGTYTLSLDVTGDADTNTEANKANVIVVLDLSGSMDFAADTRGLSSAGNYQIGHYGDVGNYYSSDYRRLYYRSGSNYYPEGAGPEPNTRHSTVYTSTEFDNQGNIRWDTYSGTRYNYTNNASRLEQTQIAVDNLIDTLLAQNGGKYTDMIELSLITFSTRAKYVTPGSATASGWVSGTDGTSLKNTVDTSYADGATNWDEALNYAKKLADAKNDGDKTFVVFFSDGEPTQHNGSASSATNHNHNNNVSGGGSSSEAADLNAAYYEARQLNGDNYDLYGIFAYGTNTGQGYMRNTISYGNYGNTSHASGNVGGYYFQAQNQEEINAAFEAIASAISSAVGIADVEIVDGTTNKVSTSAGTTELLEVDENSYKYWMSWQMPQGSNKISMFIDGVEREYTVTQSGNNVVISWDGGSATYKGTISGNLVKIQWENATGFYNYAPPAASLNDTTGAVDWNLDPVGALLDGVTYTVTFDVYPSQTALDYKARLQNGEAYNTVVPAEAREYFDEQGNLDTNTTATLYYDDTRDEAGRQESTFTNPPAVQTQSSSMSIEKEWEGDDPEDTSIPMTVMMGNSVFNTVTLEATNGWKTSSFISAGIIKNGEALPGALGHDFSFAELDDTQYHWELDAPTVRPMLIDGGGANRKPTMLIKQDATHHAPAGATTYNIEGATYYVDEQAAGLKAINHRRSNLNLMKVVTGEDAPANATFPFTLTVKNSKAPATEPTDDPNHNSDYWVWFSIYDTKAGATVTDATVSGAFGPNADGYYYAPSNTAISVQMKADWNLRFINLPTETTYTFVEGTMPEGFEFKETATTDGTTTTKGTNKTTTGTIEKTQKSYAVTYTNDYQKTDLEITKVWDDNNNNDGKRLTPAELKAKLTLSPSVEGAEPTIKDNGDGTYTITYTGLPRYRNGSEVEYSVTESKVDGYTTTGSPAKDHGTITNTLVPETTKITVKKVWDDENDIGEIRPASINVQLKAGDTAYGDSVSLNEEKKWTYTWENLPKYSAGKEINYTADETATPAGYTKQGPEKSTVDGVVTYTVTNKYTPKPVSVDPPVQKIIENNPDLYNKGDFTFKIEAVTKDAPMPANTEIKNSAQYELEGKTGYYEFGEITFTKPGTYEYKITESGSVSGVNNDPDAAKGKTITFTVTDDGTGKLTVDPTTDQVQLSFTNTYDASGQATLTVTKAIEGAEWPEGKSITFTLTGTGNAPMPETKTATLDAVGSVSFGPIKYGLTDAGKTYTYTISEDGFGKGWTGSDDITATVKVTDKGDGTLETKVTYSPENATITNTYKAKGEAEIEVTKALEGAAWPSGKTLTLTLAGTDSAPMPKETTAKLTAAGNAKFGPIAYTEADAGKTYTYTISEDGFGTGWTGSGDVKATVKVTDNGDGTLKTEVTYDPANKTITNTYKATGKAELEVTKAIEGAAWPAGKKIIFTLAGQGGTLPETKTAELTAEGTAKFGAITYTEADAGKTYTYTITEDGFGTGWTGSPAKITATVKVTDNGNGTLKTEVTYDPANKTITNTYKATGKAELEVTKALEGAGWPEGKTLTFTLDGKGGTLPETKTVKLTEEGTAKFGAITYTEADAGKTYTYTISEDGFGKGWTGSDDVKATVKVTDNGDGTLSTEVTYDPANKTITNTYKAKGEAKLEITKAVTGAAWPAGKKLTFTLAGEGGTLPEKNTVELTKEGKATFDAITYTEADAGKTYTYTISEDGFGQGWEGSGNVKATVKVTDNGDGTLKTEVSYDKNDTITNTYEASGKAQLEVTKALAGAKWPEGKKLTFTLASEDGKLPQNKTVELTKEGTAKFDEITYDQSDAGKTYTYTISEDGFGKGWTGSGDITATVKVIDNGDGTLATEVTYKNNNKTITNTYKATGSAKLEATKAIEGAAWPKGKTITFTLAGEGGTLPATKTVKLSEPGKATFGDITYTEADIDKTYTYTISEDGFGKGWTPSGDITATVKVTDNGDGTLKTEVTYSPENATITNTYNAAGSAEIKAEKILEGRDWLEGEEYTFTLKDSEGNVIDEKTVDSNEEVTFKKIDYKESDVDKEFTYTISETTTLPGGLSNSGDVTVTVKVTDNGDGTLDAAVSYKDNNNIIVNTYEAEGSVELEAIKELEGREWQEGEKYTFTLKDSEGNVIDEQEVSQNGTVTFDAIEYTEADMVDENGNYSATATYTYTIEETTTLPDGMTNTGVITATVTLTDDGEGNITAEVEYDKDDTIVNDYSSKGEAELTATKVLAGRNWLEGEEYTFTLKDAEGTVLDEQTVDSNETVTFKKIKYTQEDMKGDDDTYLKEKTFKYTISETSTLPTGISKSGDITATVVVKDDGKGNITTTVSYDNNDTITNTYTAKGEAKLEASKKLAGRPWQDGEEYTFELLDADGKVLDTQAVTADGEVEFKTIEYTLKDMVDKDGKYSPTAEYKYTIRESGELPASVTNNGNVTATVKLTDNGDGKITAEVTYDKDDTIINTYVAKPVKAQVKVSKDLTGYKAKEGKVDGTFKMILTPENDETPMPEGKTTLETTVTTVNGEGSSLFDEIEYTTTGDFKYTVTEEAGSRKGMTYDTNTYDVIVHVTDNYETGKLEATVEYVKTSEDSEDQTSVIVTNDFQIESVDVELTLTKTIEDLSNSKKDSTFEFKLYKGTAVSDENLVETKTITTENLTGSVKFSPITFEESGTFPYIVVETEGTENGFSYDTTKHNYNVVIDDNFDAAILEVNEDSTLTAEITNTYKAEPVTVSDITVKKTIEDTSGSAYETTFTFTLIAGENDVPDYDTPMPENNKASVKGEGSVTFEGIKYEKAGVYNYTVKEELSDDKGYIFDTAEYPVVVTVVDEGGKLVASVDYGTDENGEAKTEIDVVNTYDPEDAKVILKATKLVTDNTGSAPDEKFTFELVDSEGNVVEKFVRENGGPIEFSELTFSKVGTYEYVIREVAGSTPGYEYDTNEYPVTVTVTDPDRDGILKASVEGNNPEIENPYDVPPGKKSVTDDISIVKKLAGRDLKEGEFEFVLLPSDGGEALHAKNDASGKVTFPAVTFDKVGEYEFTVREVKGSLTDVTYDPVVYTVVATVTDPHNGKALKVKWTCEEGKRIVFNNTYNEPPKPTPKPKKPDTGDHNNLVGWLAVMALAGAGGTGMYVRRRRHED